MGDIFFRLPGRSSPGAVVFRWVCVSVLLMGALLAGTAPAETATAQEWELAQTAGQKALSQRNWSPAVAHLEKARAAAESFDEDDPRLAKTLTALSKAYKELRRYDESHTAATDALGIVERRFGSEHPELIAPLNALAELHWRRARHGEAEPYLRRVLSLREADPTTGVWEMSRAIRRLAEMLRYQKKFPESVALYRRSVEVIMVDWDAEPQRIAFTRLGTLKNAAYGLKDAGEFEEATDLLKQALVYEKQLRGHESIGTRVTLGEVAAAAGRVDEAITVLKELLAEVDRLDPDSVEGRRAQHDLNGVLLSLAQIHRDQERYAEAEPYYARLVKLMREGPFGFDRNAAYQQWNYANVVALQGRHEDADRLYTEVEAVFRGVGATPPPRIQRELPKNRSTVAPKPRLPEPPVSGQAELTLWERILIWIQTMLDRLLEKI